MKNFKQDFLDSQQNFSHHTLVKSQIPIPKFQEPKTLDVLKSSLIRMFSPLLLSLITSPMNIGSIYMQLSDLTKTSAIDQKLAAQPTNSRFISNGIYGDNIIFEPKPVTGYKNVFQRMGKQGIRGFYKGNLTGFLFLTSNASLRNYIFNQISKDQSLSSMAQGIATVVVCSIVDFVTYPLMTAQSRLILQDSTPNFRTYSSFVDVFRKTQLSELFKGSSLVIPKNLLVFFSWLNILQSNPQFNFLSSSILSHILIYPVTTIMRRMQVQSQEPMMRHQKMSVIQTIKSIWSANKIRSFYQGFLAYSVIHGFTMGLMMTMNRKENSLSFA